MAYYDVCPNCGSHLDPGEKCDCKEETEREKEKIHKIQGMLNMGQNGQMQMSFVREVRNA